MADPTKQSVRIAAVGDVHCTRGNPAALAPFFAEMGDAADVILLCGDLTDYGLPEEAHQLVQELSDCLHRTVIAVLGNHDYESGKQQEIRGILCDGGVTVLDGDSCEAHGVGFVGVKGFGGGFGDYCLEPWGEEAIKGFVREGVNEALKLEAALARIHSDRRIAVLHYAPVEGTVVGEPPQVFPFLGSRRLEEPLNRFRVSMVFHGHSHNGTPEGRTAEGIPVYNVAKPLLERRYPNQPGFRLVELPIGESVAV
ncbi:MAG TPA: metallophosphoesterase [Chloroflexota bacterium]|nr:metallophosphoesterase [Chloroflexota bacterium]